MLCGFGFGRPDEEGGMDNVRVARWGLARLMDFRRFAV